MSTELDPRPGRPLLRRSLNVLLAALLLGGLVYVVTGTDGEGTITPEDTLRRMQAGDTAMVLLDVRTPSEYAGATGHLAGALAIPLQELPARMAELDAVRGKTLVVYCRTANRSGQAAAQLREAGHTVLVMTGGITRWNALDYPVVREDAR